MRAETLPSAVNAIVYFERSSGVRMVSSPPWNLTSCHDVPASPPSAAGACAPMPAPAAAITTAGNAASACRNAVIDPPSTAGCKGRSRRLHAQCSRSGIEPHV
jgi:hypothetical protein